MAVGGNTFGRYTAIIALFSAVGLVAPLILTFTPRWETNDDVAMSMVAHGYGIAAIGSPNLVFSNVLWGQIVRHLPAIQGVVGYSTATIAILFAWVWAILHFLLRLGVGYYVAVLTTLLIMARPILFPQFTINAGLLTVASILGWRAHEQQRDLGSLLVACSLAYLGFLVRGLEFLLVIFVASPLLPWRLLCTSSRFKSAILVLSLSITLAMGIDYWSYQAPEWNAFRALNALRGAYTDFGAEVLLKNRYDILSRFNYSENDLVLVKNWFFADPAIANPEALRGMLSSRGPMPVLAGNFGLVLEGVQALRGKELLPAVMASIAALILLPRRKPIVAAWGIFVSALLIMSLLGRPGVVRVYAPVVSFLVLAPLLDNALSNRRRVILAATALAANFFSFVLLLPEARASERLISQAYRDVQQMNPGRYYVTWGASFPFEYAFPVLARQDNARNISLYGLGVFTLAPFSVARAEDRAGNGLMVRLHSAGGVPVIASRQRMEMLGRYCKEHFGRDIEVVETLDTQTFSIRTVACRDLD